MYVARPIRDTVLFDQCYSTIVDRTQCICCSNFPRPTVVVKHNSICNSSQWYEMAHWVLFSVLVAALETAAMENFLARYTNEQPRTAPEHGIVCPAGLVAVLAQNGLQPDHSTLANGNCCLHSFCISLLASANTCTTLAKRSALKQLTNHRSADAQVDHLRLIAQAELAKQQHTVLWDGRTYQTLVEAIPLCLVLL